MNRSYEKCDYKLLNIDGKRNIIYFKGKEIENFMGSYNIGYDRLKEVINPSKTGIALRPSYWASVSGGKDSLFMLKLILDNPDKYPLDGVIHLELEIDYPFITNVINYMENECSKHRIKFIRIKPDKSWYDYYEKYGFPTRKARWCNSYKLSGLKNFKDYLKNNGSKLITYIGYCSDEFKRYNKRDALEIYPLVDFGITENFVLEWAKKVPLFNDYYLFNKRCGCMYCPMSSLTNLAYLKYFYPEHYSKLMFYTKEKEKAMEIQYNRPFSAFSNNAKYNSDYIDRRVNEKYLPAIKEIIRKNSI